MSFDDRHGFHRWSPAAIEWHVRAKSYDDLIPGIPAAFTRAQAEAYVENRRIQITEAFALVEHEGMMEDFLPKARRNEGGEEVPEPAGLRR